MSNPTDELTKKQQQSQNDEPPNKHTKSVSIEPMNMIDLNDDCLDHILKRLNYTDLLNVADTSKRLMQAAQLAFKSKYRKHWVVMSSKHIWSNETRISVNGFVCSLKIIRCFGQSISKLELFYGDISERQCVELDRYLKEYCASFVTELNCWTKSISKIEWFTFLSDINKFMPNLRALSLWYCNSMECITVHITHLEYLSIYAEENERENLARILASLKICLRLNPQLKSLRICGFNIDLQLLRIASECAQLKRLTIFSDKFDLGTNTRAEPIHFKNVTEFGTSGEFFDAMVSSKASISFDKLDDFGIEDGRDEESVIRFLSEYPSISQFYHSDYRSSNEVISSDILRVLPSVTEAVFRSRFPVDVAIKFVNERKLLKKFVFELAERSEYDVLQKLLDKKWRSSINDEFVIRVTLEC